MSKKLKPHEGQDSRRIQFSDKLRENATFFERQLWKKLKSGVRGEQVWRQTVVQGYIVDFYIPSYRIALELDGTQHDSEKDSRRDAKLFNKGITVLRFRNPKTTVEINDIFSIVYAEIRARQSHPNDEIPTNPQDLSKHQRGFLGLSKGRENQNIREDKHGGNVENSHIINQIRGMRIGTCRNIVESGLKTKTGCGQQVYSSIEVAKNMCRALENMGIHGEAITCSDCGLVHIRES